MSEKKSLNFGLQSLGVVGLDPRNQTWLTRIRAIVLSSILSCNYILLVIEFFATLTEIDALADTGEALVSCHQCFTKMLTIFVMRPNIERLLEKLTRFKDFRTLEDELREDVTSLEKKIHFVLKVYYHNSRIAAIAMVFKPLIMRSRIFPIQVYNFIDLFQTPYYQIVYGIETLSTFYLFHIIIGFDITFFSIVTYIYNELKIIKYQFRHLKITEGDLENGFKRLSEIIAHHDYVLSFISDLNTICSLLFVNQFLSATLGICMSIFTIISHGLPMSVPFAVQHVAFIIGINLQLFLSCFAGALITSQSQTVGNSIFYAPFWLDAPIWVKKKIIMVIQRSQKYETITVGKIYNIDLELYTIVLKASLSFLNAVIAFKQQ